MEAATTLISESDAREEVLAAYSVDLHPYFAVPVGRAALSAISISNPIANGPLAQCLSDCVLGADLSEGRRVVADRGGKAVPRDWTVVTVKGIRGGARPAQVFEITAREAEISQKLEAASARRSDQEAEIARLEGELQLQEQRLAEITQSVHK